MYWYATILASTDSLSEAKSLTSINFYASVPFYQGYRSRSFRLEPEPFFFGPAPAPSPTLL